MEDKIKIEKERLLEESYWSLIIYSGICLVIILGIMNGMEWLLDDAWKFGKVDGIITVLVSTIACIGCIYSYYYVNSLSYFLSIKEGILITRYKVIVETKDTARLQVVNSVDISQTLIGAFLGIYFVEVCYGFSTEGYTFTIDGLSKETAEDLAIKIKPRDKGLELK